LIEGSTHFDENNAVFKTLRKITKRLSETEIPYAVVGGMAMFRHGYRRFTEDIDILVTKDGLARIHGELVGLGYRPAHAGSKHFRDAETGVRIEFLTTGDYPGDGKPKPVNFPDPAEVGIEIEGMPIVSLEKLIELKLASGMSNASRLKDLADVVEMIKARSLPRDFGERLDASVRGKFDELWDAANSDGSED